MIFEQLREQYENKKQEKEFNRLVEDAYGTNEVGHGGGDLENRNVGYGSTLGENPNKRNPFLQLFEGINDPQLSPKEKRQARSSKRQAST